MALQPARGASRRAQRRLNSATSPRGCRDAAEGGVANPAQCDMKHLEKVIKSVKTVSGVLDVERVYR